MTDKELERLDHRIYVMERKLNAEKHKVKQIERERTMLTRKERTHRLCVRAGMLEKYLQEPTLLTDEDVEELLAFIFDDVSVQKRLSLLIEKRKKNADLPSEHYP